MYCMYHTEQTKELTLNGCSEHNAHAWYGAKFDRTVFILHTCTSCFKLASSKYKGQGTIRTILNTETDRQCKTYPRTHRLQCRKCRRQCSPPSGWCRLGWSWIASGCRRRPSRSRPGGWPPCTPSWSSGAPWESYYGMAWYTKILCLPCWRLILYPLWQN